MPLGREVPERKNILHHCVLQSFFFQLLNLFKIIGRYGYCYYDSGPFFSLTVVYIYG